MRVSSRVAHGEQDGGKEPAVKPTGRLPEGCGRVHEKDTDRGARSGPLCQTPLDLAAIEAAGLTAYGLKCQVEWRDTGLGTLS